jgi:hypothetical protein
MSSEMMYVLGALELSGVSVAFAGAGDGYDLRAIAGRHFVDITVLRGKYEDENTVRVEAPVEEPASRTRLLAVVPMSGGLPEVFDLVDPIWPFEAVRGPQGLVEKNEKVHARVLDFGRLATRTSTRQMGKGSRLKPFSSIDLSHRVGTYEIVKCLISAKRTFVVTAAKV